LCNKIFVLDNGKISQQGSFEELKESPGHFSQTYNKQMSILGIENKIKVMKKAG
jgi:ABC-type multidrug transport system fused ATPase/permease subunit